MCPRVMVSSQCPAVTLLQRPPVLVCPRRFVAFRPSARRICPNRNRSSNHSRPGRSCNRLPGDQRCCLIHGRAAASRGPIPKNPPYCYVLVSIECFSTTFRWLNQSSSTSACDILIDLTGDSDDDDSCCTSDSNPRLNSAPPPLAAASSTGSAPGAARRRPGDRQTSSSSTSATTLIVLDSPTESGVHLMWFCLLVVFHVICSTIFSYTGWPGRPAQQQQWAACIGAGDQRRQKCRGGRGWQGFGRRGQYL